jgi:cytochrome oxidase Cu insertion factor (SCO1/SenC/PrrC family)
MHTQVFLKGIGRSAALAGLLMSGPAFYFGSSSTLAHEGHDKPAHAAATSGAEQASGHGDMNSAKQEGQAGGHGGGYGAHSGWPEPQQLGGDFSLTDHTGRKVTLANFMGRATAFFFGYTRCDDICPLIGTKLGMAVDLMGDKADQINIAMVSVDDRNDGPEQLAAFVAKQHPRLIGLSGSRKEIYDIAAQYRVRRDYVMQNQVVRDGEQQGENHGGSATEQNGSHGGHASHEKDVREQAEDAVTLQTASVVADSEVASETARERPGTVRRVKIRSASDDATRLHNMAMAHTTHIYLLNREGQVVRYIYPSLTPEQLAKRLTDLVDGG